ncbi:MAG: amidohydrolase family protein [Ginsengibacter sp.]
MMKILFTVSLFFIFLPVLAQQKADLLVFNATIYTVDKNFSTKEALVVKDGKIIATGTTNDLLKKYDAKEKIDASGKFVYPGLIDAHAHFVDYGLGLQKADLAGTSSWDEVIEKLQKFAEKHATGWLQGEGWDQNLRMSSVMLMI